MDLETIGTAALAIAVGFSLTEVMFWHRRRSFRYATAILVSSGWFGFTYYVVHSYVRSTQTASGQWTRIQEDVDPRRDRTWRAAR